MSTVDVITHAKRCRYTEEEKIKVLDAISVGRSSIRAAAAQYGVPESTVRAWVKDIKKYITPEPSALESTQSFAARYTQVMANQTDLTAVFDTKKTFLDIHGEKLHEAMGRALDKLTTALASPDLVLSVRDTAIIARSIASIIKDFTITQDESIQGGVTNLMQFCIMQTQKTENSQQ